VSAYYSESSSSVSASQPSCDPTPPIYSVGGDRNPPGNDLVAEGLITFSKAARLCPCRRRGRNVHTSTLYRWATRGIRGVHLEVLDTPSGLCTSEPAIKRFFAKLTVARNLPSQRPQPPRDEKQHEAIEAELNRRFGI